MEGNDIILNFLKYRANQRLPGMRLVLWWLQKHSKTGEDFMRNSYDK